MTKKMYRTRKALIALTMLTSFLLAGCMRQGMSNIVLDPYLDEPDTYELDFIELHNGTIEGFGDVLNSPYTFVRDMDVSGSNGERSIKLTATLIDGADEEDAEHFASALLRHVGEAASDQYPNLAPGNGDSFGEIFELYALGISMQDESGTDIYSLSVPAGGAIPLDPDIETYEEEWSDYALLYSEGQAADRLAEMMGEDEE